MPAVCEWRAPGPGGAEKMERPGHEQEERAAFPQCPGSGSFPRGTLQTQDTGRHRRIPAPTRTTARDVGHPVKYAPHLIRDSFL